MNNPCFSKMAMAGASALLLALLVAAPGSAPLAQGWLERGADLLRRSAPGAQAPSGLSEADMAAGLIEALRVGTARVVETLGRPNGFWNDSEVRIPLPGSLGRVRGALAPLGLDGLADDLERRLNRAAEAATPRAARLFQDAIGDMTLHDVRNIFNGPNDAATRYFHSRMAAPLAGEMSPIVAEELADAGAVRAYDTMMGRYKAIPFMPDATANLTDYVVEKAIDGIFLYLGREEAAIRENPAKRTTEILQTVFGAR